MVETDETSSLELAKDAINYVLGRIAEDENIRYHMGAFTETFERLKKAHSAINGISEEAIEQEIFAHELKRKSAAQKLGDIRDLINGEYEGNEEQIVNAIIKVLEDRS
jgi:hypothetical protein